MGFSGRSVMISPAKGPLKDLRFVGRIKSLTKIGPNLWGSKYLEVSRPKILKWPHPNEGCEMKGDFRKVYTF